MGFNFYTGVWKITPRAPLGAGLPSPVLAAEEAAGLVAADHLFWETKGDRLKATEIATREPAPGSDEEISAVEVQLNRSHAELANTLERTRFDVLTRELEKIDDPRVVGKVTDHLAGWRPKVQRLRQEVSELSAKHRDLLAARRERDRANPPKAQVFIPSGMRTDLRGVCFNF
jgi:hypothetical protein